MLRALFRMLWCVSVAPLGLPVVPLVYWMLIGSSQWSDDSRARSASSSLPSLAPTSAGQSRSRSPPATVVPIVTTRSSPGSSSRTSAIIAR